MAMIVVVMPATHEGDFPVMSAVELLSRHNEIALLIFPIAD